MSFFSLCPPRPACPLFPRLSWWDSQAGRGEVEDAVLKHPVMERVICPCLSPRSVHLTVALKQAVPKHTDTRQHHFMNVRILRARNSGRALQESVSESHGVTHLVCFPGSLSSILLGWYTMAPSQCCCLSGVAGIVSPHGLWHRAQKAKQILLIL